MINVELVALRLSVFGWSLVLACLCARRMQEVQTGTPYAMAIRPLDGAPAMFFSVVLAGTNIIGYFLPVIDNLIYGDTQSRHPYNHAVVMVGVLTCLAMMVDRFAYSRAYKAKWELGWFVFVHVMIWGRQWVTG